MAKNKKPPVSLKELLGYLFGTGEIGLAACYKQPYWIYRDCSAILWIKRRRNIPDREIQYHEETVNDRGQTVHGNFLAEPRPRTLNEQNWHEYLYECYVAIEKGRA